MHIVIVGLGEVGRHLLRVLEREGHEIVAIDAQAEAVRFVEEHHDVRTITGYGASEDVLEKAGVGRSDLVVAVTDHDEVNLVIALVSHHAGAKKTIARAQRNEWARGQRGVRYRVLGGIDLVINPSVLVAHELIKVARSHGAVEVIDLAQDRIELVQVELTESSRYIDRPISSVPLPRDTLVAGIVRGGELFVPGGTDTLNSADRVYLLGRPADLPEAEALLTTGCEARRVWVVGGGVTGETIARALVEEGAKVVIVDSDRKRAQELSASLDGVIVLHGDGTDTRLMADEEVGTYDLFVAVTPDDELNLMASLLAQRRGVSRTAALVHRPDYQPIYRQLGVDVAVSPRAVASDHILRYCRRGGVKSLTRLRSGQAEVIEVTAQDGCLAAGTPLRELRLPRGGLIGAIVHGDHVIIPRGDDVIHPGDLVIVLANAAARATVERMFRPGLP